MKRVVIGILPQEKMRARTIAIACGEYRPKPGEPKVWFPSMKSLAETLSDRNLELLRIIAEQKPQSIADLADRTGRAASNLSRTLTRLAGYGFVRLERDAGNVVRPVAQATEYVIKAVAA